MDTHHQRRETAVTGAVAEMVHGKLELSLRAAAWKLGSTQREIMITLSEVVEFRPKETALHVARVGENARLLTSAVGSVSPETPQSSRLRPCPDV